LPRLFEIPPLQIIDTVRMPERGAKSKKAVITDVEIVIASPAMKKMVAVREGCIRSDHPPATLSQGFQTLRIRGFKGCDLLMGKPLGPYLLVSFLVSIIPQVQKRIKAEIVFGLFPAETGDLRHFVKIGPEGHGLEADLDFAF
jgi:hypothetical protein